ncbi:MAG: monofunctional biosynthetic peptidoglycan transglycosylase [Bacteroidales bacterium]|jgi:monofunctional biosynthetic peptidoglycan transglycosylase|nr:monofunctional biosynthetic peptidoglycan transglycosylase [Bacteroidales bacterium]
MRKFVKKVWRFFLWTIGLFFALSISLTVLYRFVNPPVTSLMVIRYFSPKENQTHRLTKDWVSIENISPHLYNGAIAAEDNLFLHHYGIDFKAIEEARKYNEKHKGKRVHGASTITQQTAKNVFLWPQRSYLRKGLEVYFTFLIELCWSKERIMEVYLNVIETGQGIYGVQRASEIYFKKPANKLSKGEAALLIACFPDPRRRRPDRPTEYLYKRQGQIMSLMNKTERMKVE